MGGYPPALLSIRRIINKKLLTWGGECGEGDKIGLFVQLAATGTTTTRKKNKQKGGGTAVAALRVSFFLNGKRAGNAVETPAPASLLDGGKAEAGGLPLALAVQPYMGGVAQILRASDTCPYK